MISALTWESPLFAILSFSGSAYVIMGIIMLLFPPKKINNLYGLRTLTSMRNQQTWDYAQIYGAKAMIVIGFLFVLISFVGLFVTINETVDSLIGIGILIALTLLFTIYVEKHLKKEFPEK